MNFTSHLHEALKQKKVETFIDYELKKGDEISPALINAIEDSHVSIVILSENYASSKWCLEELSKILECRKKQGQMVIPVFYNIDPSHVRKQTGSYEQAFAKHKGQSNYNKWKVALNEIANLAGWDSRNRMAEQQIISVVASSSSSSFMVCPKKYDVFLSFRGEDTRMNFTSHLHEALKQKKVETFIDYELKKGDEISPALINAIEDSHVSIVILSENYASSKWCLEELSKILECRKKQGQMVIPVFYNIDPCCKYFL
uniref:TMV resistance protein N n=1 Tax=Cajanus cajan TaxID=3821 RepID=A0A151SPQ2_CAJCA|nr:TMV resistance protein N [Cajanus cajan]